MEVEHFKKHGLCLAPCQAAPPSTHSMLQPQWTFHHSPRTHHDLYVFAKSLSSLPHGPIQLVRTSSSPGSLHRLPLTLGEPFSAFTEHSEGSDHTAPSSFVSVSFNGLLPVFASSLHASWCCKRPVKTLCEKSQSTTAQDVRLLYRSYSHHYAKTHWSSAQGQRIHSFKSEHTL